METIRSFVAIELPREVKQALEQLEARLRVARLPGVKWVDPEAIHLTLNFLGNIAPERTDEISKAIEEATQTVPPFQIEVKDLGAFPNLKRPQIVWVGISGEVDKVKELQKDLESNLSHLGFTPESRPFTPHLTLARVRQRLSSVEQQKLAQLIAEAKFKGGGFKVATISLMRSELTREGAIYSRISLVALKKLREDRI